MGSFHWLAVAGLFALMLPQKTFAWDAPGHELVAMMAYDRLNPESRRAVTRLATEMINPDRIYDAITISCWLDDLKRNPAMPYHGMFLSWHYIDIGIAAGDPRPSLEPGDDNEQHGNVVQALKRAMVVLQGGTDPYIETPAMACAMVMHLVADIHQPLHCATKYFVSGGSLRQDQGGNRETVLNAPAEAVGIAPFNLHAFWDSAWRASFDEATGNVAIDSSFAGTEQLHFDQIRALAKDLEQQPPPASTDLETHIDQWALESNAIARDFVYRDLTEGDSKKSCRLSSGYVAKANALARQQLVLSAWRLATLLNNTLGSGRLIPVPPSYPAGPPIPTPL